MSNQETPQAPDYTAAAQMSAADALKNARAATSANRVDTYTPTYSQTYTQDANNPDKWTTNVNLSPAQQQLLNNSEDLTGKAQNASSTALDRVQQSIGKGYDTSSLPSLIGQGQSVQDALMARLEPQYAAQQTALDTKLANQGLSPTSEAAQAAQSGLAKARNDAYIQAGLQGINTQNAARSQAFNEQTAQLAQPINAYSALQSGTQVAMPNVNYTGSMPTTAGTDYTGAAANTYNAAVGAANVNNAQNNATTSAIGNALAAYLAS